MSDSTIQEQLLDACSNGDHDLVRLLLSDPLLNLNDADVNGDWIHPMGATPFLTACQNGHQEVVSLLLADVRIDVNKPMDGGFTPFYIACFNGHKEVIELLL